MKSYRSMALCVGLCLAAGAAAAQSAPTRLRGTIEQVSADSMTMKTRAGQSATMVLTKDTGVAGVFNAKPEDIKAGSFVGVAAVPYEGGLKALEVTVFPAGMHGGEGHYAWDLTPDSSMTNGTVGDVKVTNGRTITLSYPKGETSIFVPQDVPVVTFEMADRSKLMPGAHVVVTAVEGTDGTMAAMRINVGENGVIPPN